MADGPSTLPPNNPVDEAPNDNFKQSQLYALAQKYADKSASPSRRRKNDPDADKVKDTRITKAQVKKEKCHQWNAMQEGGLEQANDRAI